MHAFVPFVDHALELLLVDGGPRPVPLEAVDFALLHFFDQLVASKLIDGGEGVQWHDVLFELLPLLHWHLHPALGLALSNELNVLLLGQLLSLAQDFQFFNLLPFIEFVLLNVLLKLGDLIRTILQECPLLFQ